MDEDKYLFLERKLEGINLRDKDGSARKTMDEVFDEKTLISIYKLMKKGVLDKLEFPISTGKEGNVFRGADMDGNPLAVKIYRTSNATYRSLAKYIEDDPRFRGVKKNRRALIYEWARKEFQNLKRYREAGLPVPEALAFKDNILVMSYISYQGSPAPQLRNMDLAEAEMREIFNGLADFIITGYRKAGLVHGDLSEFNTLYSDSGAVVIDVGQGVLSTYAMAPVYLRRDIENIRRFFRKAGIDVSHDGLDELLREVGG